MLPISEQQLSRLVANGEEQIEACIDDPLTVFLGGAGMVGDYNQDMVDALTEAGITNAVYGNYSALITGADAYLPDLIDMLGDAALLIFYNQDPTDPIVLHFARTDGCEVVWEREFLGVKIRSYRGNTINGDECDPLVIRIEMSTVSDLRFALSDIEVSRPLPRCGQFNLIGYSWGAVVAARTALYHAKRGTVVNHLALIGAPINASLLAAVKSHSNIKKVIVMNLGNYGDPIYAGITDGEIVVAAPSLSAQMVRGTGHFYYSGNSGTGRRRRRALSRFLYDQGLR
jgi:pimeloyl-ACP methyl ester carboxylesterase